MHAVVNPQLFVALLYGSHVWMAANVRNCTAWKEAVRVQSTSPLIKRLKCGFWVSCKNRGGHIQSNTLKSADDTIIHLHSMAVPRTELSFSFSTLEKLRAGEIVGSLKDPRSYGCVLGVGGGFNLLSRLLFSVGLTPLMQKYGGKRTRRKLCRFMVNPVNN